MKEKQKHQHSLLLRLNPKLWPVWTSRLSFDSYVDIWFKTGRRKAADLFPGIPVIVLGTHGLGVVAFGETVSSVESRPDPDWKEVSQEHQAAYREPTNRVCVKIRRVAIALQVIQEHPSIANLHRTARETATWLTAEQYREFSSLIGKQGELLRG